VFGKEGKKFRSKKEKLFTVHLFIVMRSKISGIRIADSEGGNVKNMAVMVTDKGTRIPLVWNIMQRAKWFADYK
jgi:hypothetical protein